VFHYHLLTYGHHDRAKHQIPGSHHCWLFGRRAFLYCLCHTVYAPPSPQRGSVSCLRAESPTWYGWIRALDWRYSRLATRIRRFSFYFVILAHRRPIHLLCVEYIRIAECCQGPISANEKKLFGTTYDLTSVSLSSLLLHMDCALVI